MLRYAEAMIAHQGQALLDEEVKLHELLPHVADWLGDRDAALAGAIRADCAPAHDPDVYPALTMIEDRVALRRQHVCEALHAAADGDAAHEALGGYIRWQIAREGEIVAPSRLGHGPRW